MVKVDMMQLNKKYDAGQMITIAKAAGSDSIAEIVTDESWDQFDK